MFVILKYIINFNVVNLHIKRKKSSIEPKMSRVGRSPRTPTPSSKIMANFQFFAIASGNPRGFPSDGFFLAKKRIRVKSFPPLSEGHAPEQSFSCFDDKFLNHQLGEFLDEIDDDERCKVELIDKAIRASTSESLEINYVNYGTTL